MGAWGDHGGGVTRPVGAPGFLCGPAPVSLDRTLTQLHGLVLLGEQWTTRHGPKAGDSGRPPSGADRQVNLADGSWMRKSSGGCGSGPCSRLTSQRQPSIEGRRERAVSGRGDPP